MYEKNLTSTAKALSVIIVVSLLMQCSPPPGVLEKPTIYTSPIGYLEGFPLNKITENKLVDVLGLPDKTYERGQKKYLAYELGEGYGLRQYIYIIENNLVVDVHYNDQGPYNGSRAIELQKKLPK